ncbi:gamma-glutamyl-gamma-aminobutyrate hydrolase family protein [Undibacterium sp. Ji49W]|uniref:gamma-glutamyl-gamma-aminobutyrate hydrolase family protein n=1 Tax=Undibacterium sp. Ji49W TaxID=3413040 RepID=UPI003BF0A5E9
MSDEKNKQESTGVAGSTDVHTAQAVVVPPQAQSSLPDSAAVTNQAQALPASSAVTQPPTPAAGPQDHQSAYQTAYQAGESPWRTLVRVVSARLRATSLRTAKGITHRTLKIGVSARIFHPQAGAKGLSSKTLQYLEESIAQWVMARDVMVFMIPSVNTNGLIRPSNIRLRDYARHLDGLVLQGGADVAPESYSQQSTRPEWSGDRTRDMYELELLHEFIETDKPLLGICRGCQLLNVAFGGSLYQDIATEVPNAIAHVNDLYDQNGHELQFTAQSSLAQLFPPMATARVNSIHHQSIKNLGRDIMVEAVSPEDNIVEAIRYQKAKFVVGLQWHPEFHLTGQSDLLDCTPILDSFLRAARETRF